MPLQRQLRMSGGSLNRCLSLRWFFLRTDNADACQSERHNQTSVNHGKKDGSVLVEIHISAVL
jgi:hypothetical protein